MSSAPKRAAPHPVTRLRIIYNPAAGARRAQALNSALAMLRAQGAQTEVVRTEARGDAERLARGAAPGLHAVIAAGGDGTLNEVINGLLSCEAPPPLGIMPFGTANVLAHELGLPLDPVAAARTVLDGTPTAIRLGRANDRYFVMMLGVGFDARVVAGLPPRLKRLLGKSAYVIETLRQVFAPRLPNYRLVLDGVPAEAAAAIIANGRYYGGTMVLADAARLTDPILHVCLFQRSERWRLLRYLVWLAMGRINRLPDYRVVPAHHITVDGPPGDPAQADGEILTRLPLDVRVAERDLRVMLPAGETVGR